MKEEERFGIGLTLPTLLLIFAILFYPLFEVFRLSLSKTSLANLSESQFVGLDNYFRMLNLPLFWTSVTNTVVFTVATVALILLGSLAMALLLNEEFVGRKYSRALLIIPWAIPPIVGAVVWRWAFDGMYGIVDYVLVSLNIISERIAWLGSNWAMLAVVVARIHYEIPFAALIILAALQTIPVDIYEAARLDGASIWQRFSLVTIPSIRAPITVVVILESMWGLRAFDVIYGMTKGGPGSSTSVLGYLVYQLGFQNYDLGGASVVASILVAASYGLTLLYLRTLYRGAE